MTSDKPEETGLTTAGINATSVTLPERDTRDIVLSTERYRLTVASFGDKFEGREQYVDATEITNILKKLLASAEALYQSDIGLLHKLHASWIARREKLAAPIRVLIARLTALKCAADLAAEKAAQAARLELEKARVAQEQQQRKLIESLRAQGRMADARQLQQTVAVLPEIVPDLVDVDGEGRRGHWSATCGDPMALIKSVAAGETELDWTVTIRGDERSEPLLQVNPRVLDYLARRLREDFALPGCTVAKTYRYTRRG